MSTCKGVWGKYYKHTTHKEKNEKKKSKIFVYNPQGPHVVDLGLAHIIGTPPTLFPLQGVELRNVLCVGAAGGGRELPVLLCCCYLLTSKKK